MRHQHRRARGREHDDEEHAETSSTARGVPPRGASARCSRGSAELDPERRDAWEGDAAVAALRGAGTPLPARRRARSYQAARILGIYYRYCLSGRDVIGDTDCDLVKVFLDLHTGEHALDVRFAAGHARNQLPPTAGGA